MQSTGSTAEPVLVIYVLLESTEASNEANFQYYLREGISENDGCLHIILVDPQRVRKLYLCTWPLQTQLRLCLLWHSLNSSGEIAYLTVVAEVSCQLDLRV